MTSIFTARLKAMRKEKGKTQADMANLLGVLRTTYGEYERGRIIPPMDRIQTAADYFEVSVDYLLGNTNYKTAEERNEEALQDVSKTMKKILEDLQKNQHAMTFDGEILDDESRELLISSIEQSLKMGKMMQRRKSDDTKRSH